MSLITTPCLGQLWRDAQIHPEWATTRLWQYIFNHIVFGDEEWVVSSQQPPTRKPGERRRVDLAVETMGSSGTAVDTRLLVMVKQAGAPAPDIRGAEYMAFVAASAYCADAAKQHVWVVTCVGSAARLWLFDAVNGTYLIPIWPKGITLAERDTYLDISIHGNKIIAALNYFKDSSTPYEELTRKQSAPMPWDVQLPAHWLDSEAVQFEERHIMTAASSELES